MNIVNDEIIDLEQVKKAEAEAQAEIKAKEEAKA